MVRNTQLDKGGDYGHGFRVRKQATLHLDNSLLEGNLASGILAYGDGTVLALNNSEVRDTGMTDVLRGNALSLSEGATATAANCRFARNADAAFEVFQAGTFFQLEDSVVRDTLPRANGNAGAVRDTQSATDGTSGCGVGAGNGGAATVLASLSTGNRHSAAMASGSGSKITIEDSVLADTQPNYLGGGNGVQVSDLGEGASVVVSGCLLDGNTDTGGAATTGSALDMGGTIISGTKPRSDGLHGDGLLTGNGGQAHLFWCLLDGNHSGWRPGGLRGRTLRGRQRVAPLLDNRHGLCAHRGLL